MRLLLITFWVLLLNLTSIQTIGFSQSYVDKCPESFITSNEEIYMRQLSSLVKLSKSHVIKMSIDDQLDEASSPTWEEIKTTITNEADSTKDDRDQ